MLKSRNKVERRETFSILVINDFFNNSKFYMQNIYDMVYVDKRYYRRERVGEMFNFCLRIYQFISYFIKM